MNVRKTSFRILTAFALLVASLLASNTRAQSQTLSIEERLAKLEAEVSDLRQENRQLRNQIGIATATSASATAEASVAPSAAAAVKADEAEDAAIKAAAEADAARVAASAKPTAPKSVPGISISALTPPKAPVSPEPPSSTAVPTTIIKASGSEQMLTVGGFIQAQAEAGNAIDSRFKNVSAPIAAPNTRNNRFYLRRARIVIGGHFAEDFDFRITAEMAGPLSDSSNMRGQLADGFITWSKYPALNLTIGQYKTSYGFEFLWNDLTLYPIEHSLATDVLTVSRQIGGQASGTFFKTRLNYTVGVFNGNGVNTSVNDNNSFMTIERITFVPVKTKIASLDWDTVWTVGVNSYQSKDSKIPQPNLFSTFSGKRIGYGIDTQLRIGPMDFWFEYLNTDFNPDRTITPPSLSNRTRADGWYGQIAYTIVPKKWEALVRYDVFDPNTHALSDETKTWTFGVNYLIKGNDLKLMLNYMTSDPHYFYNNEISTDGHGNRVLLRVQAAF